MLRKLKWIAPALVLAMVALFCGRSLRADDTATSQPSATANGSITVNVLDSTGKAAAGARVQLRAARPRGGDSSTTRPAAVTGTADSNGSYTFSGVAPGSYSVSASVKGVGRGRARVTLAEGENGAASTATVTVNLAAPPTAGN
jgi:hypothetical protein